MTANILQSLALLAPSAALAVFAWVTAKELTPESNRVQTDRWLIHWCIKGLLVPWLVWGLMNVGLSFRLQPFMPQIQAAQHSGEPWAAVFAHVMVVGLWILVSYWTVLTLAWFVWVTAGELEPAARDELRILCWTCSLGLFVPAALIGFFGGWPWLGVAGVLVVGPIAGGSRGLVNRPKLPPIYARAIARMKFGKYSEAEWEIIHELEKSEDDFEGWMMLAELYANHFRDLVEAEKTINDICGQPRITGSQVAVALHRLADWHLKRGQNPVAARSALQRIIDRFPGTHLARMARLRLSQIPSTAEELHDSQQAGRIPLPALGDALDAEPNPPVSRLERKQAAQLANSYVERLRQNPNNVEVREKLARLFAERLGRCELGIEQIELLLGMADQPEPKCAEWLGLVAAWNFKYRRDFDAGRAVLEKLVKAFPRTPQALSARRRLELMSREGAPTGLLQRKKVS